MLSGLISLWYNKTELELIWSEGLLRIRVKQLHQFLSKMSARFKEHGYII